MGFSKNTRKKNVRRSGAYKSRKKIQVTEKVIAETDYKNIDSLKKFTGETYKIITGRVTGAPAILQRRIAREIKRARYVALLPYTDRH